MKQLFLDDRSEDPPEARGCRCGMRGLGAMTGDGIGRVVGKRDFQKARQE